MPVFSLTTFVAIVVLFAGAAAAQGATKDPCALLKPAEIQALDPNAKIGNGVAETNALGAACNFTWGPRTREWGESGLAITVLDAPKAWPGLGPDVIKQGVLMKVRPGGPTASQIPGVGD